MLGFRRRRGTSSPSAYPLRLLCVFLCVFWLLLLLAVIPFFRSREEQDPLKQLERELRQQEREQQESERRERERQLQREKGQQKQEKKDQKKHEVEEQREIRRQRQRQKAQKMQEKKYQEKQEVEEQQEKQRQLKGKKVQQKQEKSYQEKHEVDEEREIRRQGQRQKAQRIQEKKYQNRDEVEEDQQIQVQGEQQEETRRGITLDLRRITDPVNELVAGETFEQIHHGLYRVISPLKDGSGDSVKFAFKTECRPASLWHGQQGWVEIALYTFHQLFYEEAEEILLYPKALPARGVVIAITEGQLQRVVHKDRCGKLNGEMVLSLENALGGGKKILRGGNRTGNRENENATVFLIGVALTWEEAYDDAVYPSKSVYAPYFTVPPIPVDMDFRDVHRFELY